MIPAFGLLLCWNRAQWLSLFGYISLLTKIQVEDFIWLRGSSNSFLNDIYQRKFTCQKSNMLLNQEIQLNITTVTCHLLSIKKEEYYIHRIVLSRISNNSFQSESKIHGNYGCGLTLF